MKSFKIAVLALSAGALALGGAANAKPKHHHPRHHARHVVVKRVYVVGERLPTTYYSNRVYYVRPSLYQLPPAPYGYEYVRVGNAVYLTQTQTGMVSQVITNLLR